MISTVSQSTSIVTVSVGQEVRVLENHRSQDRETQPAAVGKKVADKVADRTQDSGDSKPVEEPVDKIISRLQEALQHVEPRIELSIDKELNRVVFRVFDKESGELIKQIPSEEVLELDRFFADQSGLLVEEEI